MILGSHVSFGPEQLLGSTKEAISYGANTFMFYTGAPQNTMRKSLNNSLTNEAHKLMQENNISLNNVICHAPYIINLANNDPTKYQFSITFLKGELTRCKQLGVKYLVLHPGSSVGLEKSKALENIIFALNQVITDDLNVMILLESMAGKGTEIGSSLEELKHIIDSVRNADKIGICLDTCHLNDAGYNMGDFNQFIKSFDELIGLKYLKCIHLNDTKNILGSHKDRHANIGLGSLGFKVLYDIATNELLEDIPKILETPYIGKTDEDKKRIYPPYKFEIMSLLKGEENPNLLEDIRNYYKK